MSTIESTTLETGAVVALPPGGETETFPSMADVLRELGDIAPSRVRLAPRLGLATERQVVRLAERDGRLFELVQGVLVEKAMGVLESSLAAVLVGMLRTYGVQHDLGLVLGADGMVRLASELIRIPDTCFVRWDRLPGRSTPEEPVLGVMPDFIAEVLSPSNTRREMERKLREYFSAGARLVWYVDPAARTVTVYTGVSASTVYDESHTLDGGEVLPGFIVSIADWFAAAKGPRKE